MGYPIGAGISNSTVCFKVGKKKNEVSKTGHHAVATIVGKEGYH